MIQYCYTGVILKEQQPSSVAEVCVRLLIYVCSSPEETVLTGVLHSNTLLLTVKSWDIFSLMSFFECLSWSVGKWQRWWGGIMRGRNDRNPQRNQMTCDHVSQTICDWTFARAPLHRPDNTRVKLERLVSTHRNLKNVESNVASSTCSFN